MSDKAIEKLSPEAALDILESYVKRNLGLHAVVSGVSFREDHNVWECWVSGVEGYVKAYIVRLAPSNGDWLCRHITVMDAPKLGRSKD
jgi:hypothetical protein